VLAAHQPAAVWKLRSWVSLALIGIYGVVAHAVGHWEHGSRPKRSVALKERECNRTDSVGLGARKVSVLAVLAHTRVQRSLFPLKYLTSGLLQLEDIRLRARSRAC
jgi:hypothetical protein